MNTITALSLGRIGVGITAIARPALLSAAMGQGSDAPLLTQWFGSREIAVGAATLLASGPVRRNLVLLGVAVDAGDAVTSHLGREQGELDKPTAGLLIGIATGAVAAGLLGLRTKQSAGPDLP